MVIHCVFNRSLVVVRARLLLNERLSLCPFLPFASTFAPATEITRESRRLVIVLWTCNSLSDKLTSFLSSYTRPRGDGTSFLFLLSRAPPPLSTVDLCFHHEFLFTAALVQPPLSFLSHILPCHSQALAFLSLVPHVSSFYLLFVQHLSYDKKMPCLWLASLHNLFILKHLYLLFHLALFLPQQSKGGD